jgi:hypothetical protein
MPPRAARVALVRAKDIAEARKICFMTIPVRLVIATWVAGLAEKPGR